MPEIQRSHVRGKALAETENLRLIESAKAQFTRANPGVPIARVEQLYPFLPEGKLPVSPWASKDQDPASYYGNVLDLQRTTTSPANGDANKEPPVGELANNGFNDLQKSNRVYYKAPVSDPWRPPSYTGSTGVGTGDPGSTGGTGTGSTGDTGTGSTGTGSTGGTGTGITGDTGTGSTGTGSTGGTGTGITGDTGTGSTGTGSTGGTGTGITGDTGTGSTGSTGSPPPCTGYTYLPEEDSPDQDTGCPHYGQPGCNCIRVFVREVTDSVLCTKKRYYKYVETGTCKDCVEIRYENVYDNEKESGKKCDLKYVGTDSTWYKRENWVCYYKKHFIWVCVDYPPPPPPTTGTPPPVTGTPPVEPPPPPCTYVAGSWVWPDPEVWTQAPLPDGKGTDPCFQEMRAIKINPKCFTVADNPNLDPATRAEAEAFVANDTPPSAFATQRRATPGSDKMPECNPTDCYALADRQVKPAIHPFDPATLPGAATKADPYELWGENDYGKKWCHGGGDSNNPWNGMNKNGKFVPPTLWVGGRSNGLVSQFFWNCCDPYTFSCDWDGDTVVVDRAWTPGEHYYSEQWKYMGKDKDGNLIRPVDGVGHTPGSEYNHWEAVPDYTKHETEKGDLCHPWLCAWHDTYPNRTPLEPYCNYICEPSGGPNSPILIDVFGLGHPDLLAGPKAEWRQSRRTYAPDTAFREFNLDLNGPKMWEWVGPKSGILVYWKAEKAEEIPQVIDGTALFGNHTFGQNWAHGYEPLATLDLDRDGQLLGNEMAYLWIWVDANSNALVDKGEIKAASSYVKALNTVPTEERVRPEAGVDAWAPKGAILLDGRMVPSWDWWSKRPVVHGNVVTSYQGKRFHAPLLISGSAPLEASVYQWSCAQYPSARGFLRFLKVNQEWYAVGCTYQAAVAASPVFGGAPAVELVYARVNISASGEWSWKFQSVWDTAQDEAKVSLLEEGRTLVGHSRLETSATKMNYSWGAELVQLETLATAPVTVRALYAALVNFRAEDFSRELWYNPRGSGPMTVRGVSLAAGELPPLAIVPLSL